MKNRHFFPKTDHVTIRVAGKLFAQHLPYLDQLIHSAADCQLWPVLNLAHLEELDGPAVFYLLEGENRDFEIAGCPSFVRDRIEHETGRAAA
jgi:hypothetical protein